MSGSLEWSHAQLRHLFSCLRIWTAIGITPLDFQFEPKNMTFCLSPTKSKWKKLVSKMMYGINFAYLAFHAVILLQALNSKLYETTMTKFILNLCFFIVRLCLIFPLGNTSVVEALGLGLILSRQSQLNARLGKL